MSRHPHSAGIASRDLPVFRRIHRGATLHPSSYLDTRAESNRLVGNSQHINLLRPRTQLPARNKQAPLSTTTMSKRNTPTTAAAATTAAPPKPHPTQSLPDNIPSAGTVLVALTASLVCWLLTGAVGHTAPRMRPGADYTAATMFFWAIQLGAGVFLVGGVGARRLSSIAAALSAALVGAGVAGAWGVCVADWGNAATWAFWVFAGVYAALGVEAGVGGCRRVERWIAGRLEG
jgi:hypothetical protein